MTKEVRPSDRYGVLKQIDSPSMLITTIKGCFLKQPFVLYRAFYSLPMIVVSTKNRYSVGWRSASGKIKIIK
jgi:hypothetical protein